MIGIIVRNDEEKYKEYILDINQTDQTVGFHIFKNDDKDFFLNFMIDKDEWEQVKSFIDQSMKAEEESDKEWEEKIKLEKIDDKNSVL